MTEQRAQDDKVSATYREFATERSPPGLDQKVLRMAEDHARRPQYSRLMRWTRPLAWAATIALCLAITLELARLPAPPDSIAVPTVAEPKPREAMSDAAPAERREVASPAAKLERQDAAGSAGTEERNSADVARRRQANDELAEAELLTLPSAARLTAKDDEMPRQTETMGRAQSMDIAGNNAPAMEESTFMAVADAPTNACSQEQRAQPESWLECVEALRELNADDAAAIELDALIAGFPDFKLH